MKSDIAHEPVDIVVTWVDGSDPEHRQKRNHYLGDYKKLPAIAVKERRFSDNGEIFFCLRSIATHMPWVNRVYVVTDNQVPPCLSEASSPLPQWFVEKVRVVDHTEIFEGYEYLLPTFNSLSIETFVWRIKGLSEHFLYLNDDMFFCGPLKREDFFRQGKIVLRGKWSGWDELESSLFMARTTSAALP